MRIESADDQNVHAKLYTAGAYWVLARLVALLIRWFNNAPLVFDYHARDFAGHRIANATGSAGRPLSPVATTAASP
jgi:hypothetical protein